MSSEQPQSFRYKRWLAFLAALVGILVALVPFVGSSSSFQSRRQLGETATKPNIVLFVLDQWRYDWDGLTRTSPTGSLPLKMGYMRAAATKGIRFGQAYVPSPLCAPVRACLAAGKEYDQAGVPQNHGDDWPLQQETFYKILRDEANYTVMSCGKDDLYKNDINFPFYKNLDIKETAIDLGFTNAMRSAGKTKVTKGGPPFEAYREFLENTMVGDEPQAKAFNVYTQCHDGPTGADGNWTSDTLCTADKFTEQIYPDNFVAAEAMKLIGLRDKSKPFFLQINFPGPHYPMMSTATMAESVADRQWPPPVDAPPSLLVCPQKTGDNIPQFGGRCNYAAELENLDRQMDLITRVLAATKADSTNTIFCIVGDHGEMLGEHSLHGKKVPWQPSISVPLVCFGPGIQVQHYLDPVTTLDLPGTFMDFAGVTPNKDMSTKSLRGIFEGGSTPSRDFVWSGLDNWRLVIQKIDGVSYKLICCKNTCHPGPTTLPKPELGAKWQMVLYETQRDRFDMSPIFEKPEIMEALRQNLPEGWCPDPVKAPVQVEVQVNADAN